MIKFDARMTTHQKGLTSDQSNYVANITRLLEHRSLNTTNIQYEKIDFYYWIEENS
jgi:hypothetical protein